MSSEIVKILEDCLNKVIIIKLRNKKTIQGNLQAFDQQMNLILTNSKDITEDDVKSLDKIILRADNIIIVALPDKSNSLNSKDNASN
ncbi:MAG: LSM domain-containing protein [Nitrosopumilaceae archaeon]